TACRKGSSGRRSSTRPAAWLASLVPVMTSTRRALVASALGAGISYSNLAVALPLLVLAEHGSASLAGALLGANTIAFSLGVPHAASIRFSFGVGAIAALLALPAAAAWLGSSAHPTAPPRLRPAPLRGFALQLPDLLLVAAMGMLLNLAPVVLNRDFRFTPLAVGFVSGAVAAAKIGGSITAGRIAHTAGSKRAVGAMLAGSAVAAAVLAGTHEAYVYVLLTVATAFLAVGVWPVVVDGALARVSPEERHGLSILWNVREYAAIAATTALGGYLLDVSARPTLLLALAAVLLATAAVSALAVLGRPVYAPRTA